MYTFICENVEQNYSKVLKNPKNHNFSGLELKFQAQAQRKLGCRPILRPVLKAHVHLWPDLR